MTQFLPPNLLALFAAREPIPFLQPIDNLGHERKRQSYTGLRAFLNAFERDVVKVQPVKIENKEERTDRKRKEKAELAAYRLEQDLALWDPKQNAKATEDPYKTLFVSRIAYDTSESKLRREFGVYGRIRSVRMIHNIETGAPRGYAFIEFEKEADMHAAYKYADGKKIDGRRVVVDVERGRTVKGWRPRRLAGGLGGSRRVGRTGDNVEASTSAAQPARYPSMKYRSDSRADEPHRYESRRHRENSREQRRDQRGSYNRRRSPNDRGHQRQRFKSPRRSSSHQSPPRTEHRRRHHHRVEEGASKSSSSRSPDRWSSKKGSRSSRNDSRPPRSAEMNQFSDNRGRMPNKSIHSMDGAPPPFSHLPNDSHMPVQAPYPPYSGAPLQHRPPL